MKGILSSGSMRSTFTFGHYPQFANGAAEPIKWIILVDEKDRVFVLSLCALDAIPYHNSFEKTTWDKCSQRAWLNEHFLTAAFSEEERKAIMLTKHYERETQGSDYIFSLSNSDILFYLPNEEERICELTEHAKKSGAYATENNKCLWWLRTQTGYPYRAQIIERNGTIYMGSGAGAEVDDPQIAIRPAMWLSSNTLVEFV